MRRRDVLKGGIAGTAIATLGAHTISGRNRVYPDISISTDTSLTDIGFDIQSEVKSGFSSEKPAEIEMVLKNKSLMREIEVGPTPPFSTYTSDKEDPQLLLIPHNRGDIVNFIRKGNSEDSNSENNADVIPSAPIDDCWQIEVDIVTYAVANPIKLEHGETVSREYSVLQRGSNHDCLPKGRYQFSTSEYHESDKEWNLMIDLK